MKKLLYSSIILGAGLFAFGIQGNNVLTVKAADEVSAETPGDKADTTESPATEIKTDSKSVEEPKDKGNVADDSNDSPDNTPVQEQVVDLAQVEGEPTNRNDIKEDNVPFVEIKPTEEAIKKNNLQNTDDPAKEGKLLVPYDYHGNGAVYVLDENGQPKPLPSEKSDDKWTGYEVRTSQEVYKDSPDYLKESESFTGEVYSIYGDFGNLNNSSRKYQLLAALLKEGSFFMEFRNHGYSNTEELVKYRTAFKTKHDEIMALNDDGTPVVKTPVVETTPITGTTTVSHHHSSSTTQSNAQTNDKLPLVVVAIRQAKLYSADGTEVTDRGLSDASVWMVDKVSTINGQKMYRISADEWVAASDVI